MQATRWQRLGALCAIFVGGWVPAASPPVESTSSLYGVYVVGPDTVQLLFYRTSQDDFSGYRLYWWALGGSTNIVDLPRTAQRILLCGLTSTDQPTYVMATVLNGVLESVPSNTLAVPPAL